MSYLFSRLILNLTISNERGKIAIRDKDLARARRVFKAHEIVTRKNTG